MRQFQLHVLAVAAALALGLTACGGGGNVRSPPPTTPTAPGIGFTPTVANDASLTALNPPVIAVQAAPVTFADPSLDQHLILTNAAGALGAGKTGQGVTIGFVDTGVNRNHAALTPRVTRNFVHVDANNDLSVDDKVGHGTIVATLAAGKPVTASYRSGSTGIWGGGIAQDAKIVASRIISDAPPVDDGSGEGNEITAGQGYGDFFQGIHAELADAGAKIINNSWGGLYWSDPALTTELTNAYADFIVTRGGIIVFANGNSGEDARFRPNPSDNAALPALSAAGAAIEKGWLTVGALDTDNPTQLTDYSQACGIAMNFCLVAPGDVVFTDYDDTGKLSLYSGGGTSFAAPLVTGAAAVVWSAFPYFNNDLVRQSILGAAKDLGAPGVDAVFGWGLLDVTKAANGPSNFAWGDVNVSFAGNSVWRNRIVGSGGLIKAGSGTLTLAEAGSYIGATQVQAGGLDVRKGLASNLSIVNGATVWASGAFGGNVSNDGRFLNGASVPASIAGNFIQSSTGNLGVWLGSTLQVTGTATLNGQLSVLGVKSGYTTTSKETLLNAASGVSGTFATLRAAPNVFLDATLAYDPKNVFLNINRINVAKAVAGMGLSTVTQLSAQRVESAMGAIDAQLAGGAPAGIDSAFIDAAGQLQHAANVASADLSLRSLSGELHAASSAMTFDAIDANRRVLSDRFAELSTSPLRGGGWYRDLHGDDNLAQAGFDGVGLQSDGELVGADLRLTANSVVGAAYSKVQQASWLTAFGDRSRGRQQQAQLYAGWWGGDWYAHAQLASGGFQREMQRNLVLGTRDEAVATRLSGDYAALAGEVGRSIDAGGFSLIPYLGSQGVRVSSDGFAEQGADGFGLRAQAWDSWRWQGYAGLRVVRGWRLGGLDVSLDGRSEWQHAFVRSGELFDASFTGLAQWAPLQGIGLARDSRLLGLGMLITSGLDAGLRLDLSRRASDVSADTTLSAQYRRRF